MSTLIAYSETGNGGGRTHTDSHASMDNTNDTWATVRNGSGDSVEASRANMQANFATMATSPNYRQIYRVLLSFDTSSITANGVISAATLAVTAGAIGSPSDDFTDSISLVGATPGDAGSLVGTDYAQFQTTKFATDITVPNMETDGTTPNTYTLNDDGEAAINKTGVTSFGLRSTRDNDDNEPSHPSAVRSTTVWFHSADEAAAGDERPVLTVTYTITFTPKAIMF